MPWSDDDLGLWRHLVAYSGLGPQQQLAGSCRSVQASYYS